MRPDAQFTPPALSFNMSMYPCKICHNNSWGFEHNEGWIIATCQECGREVGFPDRKNRPDTKKKTRPPKFICEFRSMGDYLMMRAEPNGGFDEVELKNFTLKNGKPYIRLVRV